MYAKLKRLLLLQMATRWQLHLSIMILHILQVTTSRRQTVWKQISLHQSMVTVKITLQILKKQMDLHWMKVSVDICVFQTAETFRWTKECTLVVQTKLLVYVYKESMHQKYVVLLPSLKHVESKQSVYTILELRYVALMINVNLIEENKIRQVTDKCAVNGSMA